jgi:O-antigen/teichoic acid export membrane protein
MTSARVVGLVFTLVQLKITVAYLGPAGYGLLTTVVLFIGAFEAWTEFGVGTVVVRRVSGGGQSLERMVGISQSLSLLMIVPLVLVTDVVGALVYRDKPIVVSGIVLLSLGLAASTWSSCYLPVAQVVTRFGGYASADLAGRVLSLALTLVAVGSHGGLMWFFAAQLVFPLLRCVVLETWARHHGRFRPVWHRGDMLSVLRETLPLAYILVVGALYFRIDGLMLSKLSTDEEVGAYGLAYRVVANVTVLSSSISSVLISRYATDWSRGPARFAGTLRSSIRLMFVMCIPLAAVSWTFAPEMVRLISTEQFVDIAARPLALLFVAIAIGMVSDVMSSAVLASHGQGSLVRLNTATLVLNLALNAVLIPRSGGDGPAPARVVCEGFGMVCILVILRRKVQRFLPWRGIAQVAGVTALVLVGDGLLSGLPWGVRAAWVVVAYPALLLLTRTMTYSEIMELTGRASRPQSTVTDEIAG